ncbi:MAG: Rrf2 family transcriptional regulator [Phycisphaeraceae bacterium]|nr:Rrf2 family transcriptional regulator [Phycisphaeraceae bacterium]
MFSSTSEYALRAVVHLASNPDKPCTTGEIAEAMKVPAGYLSKVLQSLARAGIVSAQRGPTGGFTLDRHADRISVLDVINAVDPIERITECPIDLPEHAANLCPLHARLDEAIALVQTALGASTIAEMIEKRRGMTTRPVAPTIGRRPIRPTSARPAEAPKRGRKPAR